MSKMKLIMGIPKCQSLFTVGKNVKVSNQKEIDQLIMVVMFSPTPPYYFQASRIAKMDSAVRNQCFLSIVVGPNFHPISIVTATRYV